MAENWHAGSPPARTYECVPAHLMVAQNRHTGMARMPVPELTRVIILYTVLFVFCSVVLDILCFMYLFTFVKTFVDIVIDLVSIVEW